ALVAEQNMQPLGREFMTPLDEGMVMDMPITVPRASITQGADDLKARDMILCRFPEVLMVVGKVGRAETPTDPAPLDMIETMIELRPAELSPKAALRGADAERQAAAVLAALVDRGLADRPDAPADLVNEAVMAVLPVFDAQMREYAYQRNKEFERELGPALARITLERVAALLEENGSLARPLPASELSRLARAAGPRPPPHPPPSPTPPD